MKMRVIRRLFFVSAAAATLASCGGGGSTGTNFIPTAPVTPTPPPPPPSTSPLPPPHIGLVSSSPFAVLAVGDTYKTDSSGQHITLLSNPARTDVQFSYDPSSNVYFISLPGFQRGMLGNTGYSGSAGQVATGSTSAVLELSMGFDLPVFVTLPVPGSRFSPYTYTSFASWDGQTGVNASGEILRSEGLFAYGIPTGAGDVPSTGTASYTAGIQANLAPGWGPTVGGTVDLLFDFGAGKLSGSMHPLVFDFAFGGAIADYGQFPFTQTVYSTGSTTFSGKFVVPGLPNEDSSFNGNFTGPGAAELMARFSTPSLLNGVQGTISGIWIGKKN